MKFSEFLLAAIQRSEIPLRFEPGAGEAVAKPVTEAIKAWVEAHRPPEVASDFALGQQALIDLLLREVDGRVRLPE